MITINLLPESYRKPKASPIEQLPRSPLTLIVVGGLVGVTALLGVVWQIRQAHAAVLAGQLNSLQPKKMEVDKLMAAVQTLRDQHAVYGRLRDARSRWALLLNALSDVTPEGVWFTDLSVDQQRGLTIQGSAIGGGGEEMVRIGRLVQDLKADPRFTALVQDTQIESIKSLQDGEIEVISFTLTCRLAGSAKST